MPTVIDKLIVELGLDPADFDAGTKKAAAAQVRLTESTKRSNKEMGDSFVSFTKKFLTAAAAIALLKKLVGALADVSTETRRLGIDSENFNLAANRMRNMQNAVEMLGGNAEDVTRSVENLNKAVFDLTTMGQSSASLEMLTRLGVQFQDNTGHARDFYAIVMDTADALERAQKNGNFNRNEAYNAALQAGFDQGTAQLILAGRATIEKELAKQSARHQVNADDIAAATRIERARAEVNQRATSAGVQTLGAGGVAYDQAVSYATDAMEGLANAADRAAGAWNKAMMGSNANASQRERYFRDEAKASATKHGVPYGVLHGLLDTESKYNPNARSSAGAIGIAQFMPDTARERGFSAGVDPMRDIDEAARYLKDLHGIAVRRAKPGEDPWQLALQYYNGGIGRVTRSRNGGPALAQETIDYPTKVMAAAAGAEPTPGSSAARGNTTVNVGPITVQTAATDANGIARDLNGAVQRKMDVAQAEPGMR